jgi:hypothetical protein
LRLAEGVRARDAVADAGLGAMEPKDVFRSHVSASAIEAVCLLMADSLDLEMLMKVIPDAASSAWTTVRFALRARMHDAAWLSGLKRPGRSFLHVPEPTTQPCTTVLVPGRPAITVMFFWLAGLM